jgi:hypothetical protein
MNYCYLFRKYDACSPTPCYRTADDSMQIKPDDEIRVKVISIREDVNDLFVLGTLLDDFLVRKIYFNLLLYLILGFDRFLIWHVYGINI